MMIHHCIGPNPDHGVYRGMSEAVRVASTFINDPATAAQEIDVFPYWDMGVMVESYYYLRFEIETSVYLFASGYGVRRSQRGQIKYSPRLDSSARRRH